MKNYPQYLKNKLKSIIKEMSNNSENFVKNPHKDFTRIRKVNFETLLTFILSMNGKSLNKELLEYFNFEENIISSSAIIQQRAKLLPESFQYLFHKFTSSHTEYETFKGYRLLAVDGSKINIPHNPNHPETFIKACQHPDSKGFNVVNMNAVFDLINKIYLDANIESIRTHNERRSAINMIKDLELPSKTLVVADRGYESYNVFAHFHEKNIKYLIRIKDNNTNSIVKSLNLDLSGEFDETINLILTRKQTNEVKNNPQIYKFLPQNTNFDYLNKQNQYYKISFRLVRFKISSDSYETLITNTDKTEFSSILLKEIYHMRWGIETSFRELKYAIGLINFHSKKFDFIIQEIFSKLTIYNFCSMITLHTILTKKDMKDNYQVNFTLAIYVCKEFFKSKVRKNAVEPLIQRHTLPIRNGRVSKRLTKIKSSVSFLYRVA